MISAMRLLGMEVVYSLHVFARSLSLLFLSRFLEPSIFFPPFLFHC